MGIEKFIGLTMESEGVLLKKGKEKIFRQKHHWIFSGAIHSYPKNYQNGTLIPVMDAEGMLLGHAYFNQKNSLAGRIINFSNQSPLDAIFQNLKDAFFLRSHLFHEKNTNSYRAVNGEGDRLPGLIVDRYGDYLVIQISTLGMELLKEKIISFLMDIATPKGIYEKSLLPSRTEEGLTLFEGSLFGTVPPEVEMCENGLCFSVSLEKGQKTGFFLDQREMRAMVGSMASGKKILNCFSYTGGFTVYALNQMASQVDSVDISKDALKTAEINCKKNGLDVSRCQFFCADAFDFLREQPLDYDFIILDPPAFAKKKEDIHSACRGYKEINRTALKKIPSKSLILTCSCSYFIDDRLFQMLIFQAAQEAQRNVKIISRHRLGLDHPINIFHPETDYLKSLLLYVD